jgi:hypothetical protein
MLVSKGHKVGNVLLGRVGRRYFSLKIAGVCFEEPQAIAELLEEMLRRFTDYEG